MKTPIKISTQLFGFAALLFAFSCTHVTVTKFSYGGAGNKELNTAQEADAREIIKILENINDALKQNNLSNLTEFVNREKGLFIDLKAQKSYAEIAEQIKNPESYLNIFFLNTKKLRETTGDSKQISVKDILSKQKNIHVELFFNESNNECEAKLILQKNKDLNFRLNNPYFIKINNKWFIYRLM